MSDSASRDLLGYRGRPGHLRRGGFPIHLPVEFIMDSDQLLDKRPAKRFTGDNNIKRASPNWTLKVKDEVLPQPKLSRGGLLCNDYLVISRIPNFTSMRAFRERNEALIIAGTHGPGTEAIQLLINDLEKLTKIQQLRAHSSFFQALIPVTGIDHFEERTLRGKRLVSKPTSLGEPQVWPISVSHAQILKAMKNKRG
ncbi:MAG: hypothetical protein HYU33_05105 [Candidatus Omnitrophica bacterium]|nr:hypothetical protein [Candidatus Omnitrophota bacterium]